MQTLPLTIASHAKTPVTLDPMFQSVVPATGTMFHATWLVKTPC